MCQAKPGPRCSADVKKTINSNRVKLRTLDNELTGLQEDYEYELKGTNSDAEKENLKEARKIADQMDSLREEAKELDYMFYATPEGKKYLNSKEKELEETPEHRRSKQTLESIQNAKEESNTYFLWQKAASKMLSKTLKKEGIAAAHLQANMYIKDYKRELEFWDTIDGDYTKKIDLTYEREEEEEGFSDAVFKERDGYIREQRKLEVKRAYLKLKIKDLEGYTNSRVKKRVSELV